MNIYLKAEKNLFVIIFKLLKKLLKLKNIKR